MGLHSVQNLGLFFQGDASRCTEDHTVIRRATGRIRQLTYVVSSSSATTIDAAALLRRQHARELVNTCATSEPCPECPFE